MLRSPSTSMLAAVRGVAAVPCARRRAALAGFVSRPGRDMGDSNQTDPGHETGLQIVRTSYFAAGRNLVLSWGLLGRVPFQGPGEAD
ncbi:hypothetical protein J1614_004155 [Plenodomus biglobosus]|nr:hypothetical protein J1614_004155 [Plenodomus biglobosus]